MYFTRAEQVGVYFFLAAHQVQIIINIKTLAAQSKNYVMRMFLFEGNKIV
jgi:hypothetical protein